MFDNQIGKTMEVYIDDMLVKSLDAGDHLKHLQETFDIVRKYNMKLNLEKCAFGVGSGKFLGFLRGIKVNPDKIKTIEDIPDKLTSVKEVQRLTGREWSIVHILREENMEVDALANLGSFTEMKRSDSSTIIQLLHLVLDVDGYCKVNSTNLVWDWRNEFIEYLKHGKLPEDPKASRALRAKETRYCLDDGHLYRRSFQRPLARCLGASKANYVVREVHERVCGNHSSVDLLFLKLVRVGYYWPRMEQDARAFVQRCEKYQCHAQLVHQAAELLHSVVSLWPFMKWGMDIVGPLPPGPGKVRFLLVLTDYFTKWVKASPYQKVRESKVVNFI
ncbi:uncharacterized protein LOC142166791 [Nicotiana tabacum]|uniref:Uncharacterized protein LOC142166791 n=1 Tax=Nicotiana tabacum TaxID=4097 RepID=A0AC58SB72_TOBAC